MLLGDRPHTKTSGECFQPLMVSQDCHQVAATEIRSGDGQVQITASLKKRGGGEHNRGKNYSAFGK